DEVHRPAIAVDQVNRPFRLVCEREDMLTGPRSSDVAAIMLGGGQLVAAAKHCTEFAPLRGARSRTMKRYDPPARDRPYRGGVVTHSFRSFFSKEKTNQVACSPSELHIRMTRMVRARIRATLPASNFYLISNAGRNRYMGNVGEDVPMNAIALSLDAAIDAAPNLFCR